MNWWRRALGRISFVNGDAEEVPEKRRSLQHLLLKLSGGQRQVMVYKDPFHARYCADA